MINKNDARQFATDQIGLSRRARRELERERSRPRILRPFARVARKIGSPSSALSRVALVGALAGITIVIPITGGLDIGGVVSEPTAQAAADPEERITALSGPATLEVLDTQSDQDGGIALEPDDIRSRELVVASRMAEREDLPGCDASGPFAGTNGNMAASALCGVWDGTQFRSDAAQALTDLNQDFRAQFGRDICITGGYRTFASQQSLKARKGALAATPGRSQHGWGLAADLCGAESRSGTTEWQWMDQNGPIYGWENPAWARPGGAGAYEPWHWEFQAE